MKNLLLLTVLLGLISCTSNRDRFYMPAEWEHQDVVWFGWEKTETFFYPVVAEMIAALMPHVKVKIAVSTDSLMKYMATTKIVSPFTRPWTSTQIRGMSRL